MAKKTSPKVEIVNNTNLSLEAIAVLPVLGDTVNKWRGRNIVLFKHPTDESRLISIGTTFDGLMVVIADEDRQQWATALRYIANGKIYVSE